MIAAQSCIKIHDGRYCSQVPDSFYGDQNIGFHVPSIQYIGQTPTKTYPPCYPTVICTTPLRDFQPSSPIPDNDVDMKSSEDSLLFNLLETTPEPNHHVFHQSILSNSSVGKFSKLRYPTVSSKQATNVILKTVNFVKNLQAFRALPFGDQIRIFRRSWMELFVIGLAQDSVAFEVEEYDFLAPSNGENASNKLAMIQGQSFAQSTEVNKLINFIRRCCTLKITDSEYAYFKGIVLFNPDIPVLKNRDLIVQLQTESQKALFEHQRGDTIELLSDGEEGRPTFDGMEKQQRMQKQFRVAQILLSLPTLRSMKNQAIVNFFFHNISESSAAIENMLVEFLIRQ